ncbi:MAG: hypothetical protein HY016_12795 [Nitrosomonadales bacterium]|nr:hypothetical protein [Nitrosomonadales bacterium]
MQIALPPPVEKTRRLVPFLLLSLLLHVAIFILVRPLENNFSITPQRPMEVYFLAPKIVGQVRILEKKVPTKMHNNPMRISASPETPATPPTAPLISETPAAPSQLLDSHKLMESAKNIARDEARKTEQQTAALEKKRLNTPIGLLEQYLQLPHEEIHLPNGMLKIQTSKGTICFQPAPYFAQDSTGLFGIPTTCP